MRQAPGGGRWPGGMPSVAAVLGPSARVELADGVVVVVVVERVVRPQAASATMTAAANRRRIRVSETG